MSLLRSKSRTNIIIIIINLFNVDINIAIKIIYKKTVNASI